MKTYSESDWVNLLSRKEIKEMSWWYYIQILVNKKGPEFLVWFVKLCMRMRTSNFSQFITLTEVLFVTIVSNPKLMEYLPMLSVSGSKEGKEQDKICVLFSRYLDRIIKQMKTNSTVFSESWFNDLIYLLQILFPCFPKLFQIAHPMLTHALMSSQTSIMIFLFSYLYTIASSLPSSPFIRFIFTSSKRNILIFLFSSRTCPVRSLQDVTS